MNCGNEISFLDLKKDKIVKTEVVKSVKQIHHSLLKISTLGAVFFTFPSGTSFNGISVGFFWECVADIQLNKFKRNKVNQKTFLQSGLWSLSRHPNYFGELLFWGGLAMIGSKETLAWIGSIGPLSLCAIMCFITGPITERNSVSKHKERYIQYQKTVPFLIPKIGKTNEMTF